MNEEVPFIPTASATDLRERWETASGEMARSMVLMSIGVVRKQFANLAVSPQPVNMLDVLKEQVAELPYVEEVLPELDLRGFTMPEFETLYLLDLKGARLDYLTLGVGGINYCDLTDAVLDHMQGEAVRISGEFRRCSFVGAQLNRANLSHLHFVQAIFDKANLQEVTLKESNLRTASMREADLRNADLTYAILLNTDFTDADLRGTSLHKVEFNDETVFHGARINNYTRISDDLRKHLETQRVIWE